MALPDSVFQLPADADHPVLRAAFAYWAGKAPSGRLPGRQHIDPIEMRAFLPHIALLGVERGGKTPRFRVRVAGTAVVTAMGGDVTGRYLDEYLQPGQAAPTLDRLTELLTSRQPYFIQTRMLRQQREFVLIQRLILPLAADGETVDMILTCAVADGPPVLKGRL